MTFTISEQKLLNEVPKKDYIRKGISIPFSVNQEGKIKLSEGQELDEQDILINILNTNNDNAFFQMFNFDALIFKKNSSDIRTPVLNRLKAIFDMFERQHRMRLKEESLQVQQVGQFVYISFEYFDIEQNQNRNIAIQGSI